MYCRVFPNGSYYKSKYYLVCTCGHSEELPDNITYYNAPNVCPKCGSKVSRLDYRNPLRTKLAKQNVVDIDFIYINEKSFHLKKKIIKTDLEMIEINDTILPKIIVEKEDVFEMEFDATNINNTKIYLNGVQKPNSENYFQKALSYIKITDEWDNTIFKDMFLYFNMTTLSSIVYNLTIFPQYEIFYNTYGSLKNLKGLSSRNFTKGSSPSKIMDMPKKVWNCIYELNLNYIKENVNDSSYKYILPHMQDLLYIYKDKPDIIISILTNAYEIGVKSFSTILDLIKSDYNPTRLKEYLTEDIYVHQGIDSPVDGLQILYDYVHMSELMSIPYEKYPKSLKLRHDLTSKNFKLQIDDMKEKEMDLVLTAKDYQRLKFEDKEYSVIVPSCTKDIIMEGKLLSHCVDSYIDAIQKKKTKIVFMRETKDLNTPLLTLEVKNGILNQYSGFGNRRPTEKEMEFILKYVKTKKLEINKRGY